MAAWLGRLGRLESRLVRACLGETRVLPTGLLWARHALWNVGRSLRNYGIYAGSVLETRAPLVKLQCFAKGAYHKPPFTGGIRNVFSCVQPAPKMRKFQG